MKRGEIQGKALGASRQELVDGLVDSRNSNEDGGRKAHVVVFKWEPRSLKADM